VGEVLVCLVEAARSKRGLKFAPALVAKLVPQYVARHLRHAARQRSTPPDQLQFVPAHERLVVEECPLEALLMSGVLAGWRQRRIVACRIAGLTYEEIAEDLHTTVGEVHRVMRRLAAKVLRQRAC
jgi:DNA-directed RNA polymerase specialized sigma24 family protein